MKRLGLGIALIAVSQAAAAATPAYDGPAILSLRERKTVMDAWVATRLERIVPQEMRRYGFDMWLVICNESVEDPVFRALVPVDPWAARRLSMLVFFDRGAPQGVERLLVAYHSKGLYTKDWSWQTETQWEALARVVRARDPRRIGIDEAVKIPYGDGLTAGLKRKLVDGLGPDLAARLGSAEELAVAVLERRLSEELPVYEHVVAVAKAIIRQGLSSAVITPGVTTLDDLDWWLNQRVVDLGLGRWFFNDTSLQRAESAGPKDRVIRRGDLVHVDFGIEYLGLHTDTQELAYVLRPGEPGAPAGLVEGLERGNLMQDILMQEFRLGRTGNEVQAAALERGRAEGLAPRVYTHPIGLHGHGAGAFVGLPNRQDGVPEKGEYPIHAETAYSIELSVDVEVPEWNGQKVRFGLEQEAFFDGAEMRFIGGRQTSLHVVR